MSRGTVRRGRLEAKTPVQDIQLEGGVLLFLSPETGGDHEFVTFGREDIFDLAKFTTTCKSVKYVLREKFSALAQELQARGFQASGRVVSDSEVVHLRLLAEGRLQIEANAPKSSETKPAPKVEAVPEASAEPLKVLIVDDSSTMRAIIKKNLMSRPEFKIVGETGQPREVIELLRKHKPDVMTLDIHMPDMNGVEVLESLPADLKIPAVVVSSLSMEEGSLVIKALEIGAIDYLKKPAIDEIPNFSEELARRLLLSRQHRKVARRERKTAKITRSFNSTDMTRMIAIGASTGGTEAIKDLMTPWPKEVPPILITQHIPPYFSKAFADRLNEICAFEVREAQDGDELRPGLCLVAPGGFQMSVKKVGAIYKVVVQDGDLVTGHKPSVDHLFRSVANTFGSRAVAMILTGMGKDGADGLLKIRQAGGRTLGQDEQSCVVYGMPKAAFLNGAVERQVSLQDMPEAVLELLARKKAA